MDERIGFVGVGRMGANMARRLKDCGFPVVAVYDVRGELAEALARELGCAHTTSLARVTELSDIILTGVSDDAAMKRIFASSGDRMVKAGLGELDKSGVAELTFQDRHGGQL